MLWDSDAAGCFADACGVSAKGGEQGSDDGYDGATDDGQGLFGAFFHID